MVGIIFFFMLKVYLRNISEKLNVFTERSCIVFFFVSGVVVIVRIVKYLLGVLEKIENFRLWYIFRFETFIENLSRKSRSRVVNLFL